MVEEWSLRDEIFYTAHRWPIFSLFCLAGAFLGFLVAFAWPSPYRATKELYIGLNIYQASEDSNAAQFSGIQFQNADDYKNWQMANLNSLVYMDAILDQMLLDLREVDAFWNTVTRQEIAQMLHVYWRNAGKWRLVAEHRDAKRAEQAVLFWEAAVINYVAQAIDQTQLVMTLDIQLQATAARQAEIIGQIGRVAQIQQELQKSQALLSSLPAGQELVGENRWQIWFPVSQAASGPEWLAVLEAFPGEPAAVQKYRAWVNQAAEAAEGRNEQFKRTIFRSGTRICSIGRPIRTGVPKKFGALT